MALPAWMPSRFDKRIDEVFDSQADKQEAEPPEAG
jgi:hypothetical protein